MDYGWPVGLLAILGGHVGISKCKRMPKLDLLISGDILRSLFFASWSAASHRRPKVDYRSESGEPTTIGIIDEAASWGWLALSLDYSTAPSCPWDLSSYSMRICGLDQHQGVFSTFLLCCIRLENLINLLHEGVACLFFPSRGYILICCLIKPFVITGCFVSGAQFCSV